MTSSISGGAAFGVVLAFLVGAIGPAFAQTHEESFSPAYQKCMDASGGVNALMLECGDAEYFKLDARLNAAYRKAQSGLTAEQRVLLRDTQRAWLAHRDASCSFKTRLGDRGTIARLSDQSCLLSQTTERAKWLEDIDLP